MQEAMLRKEAGMNRKDGFEEGFMNQRAKLGQHYIETNKQ
jgi:hypothetical protein